MATHFARGTLTEGHLVSARLSSACHNEALKLPEHRRTRFLASRALLAELLFMLYGTSELPDILTQPEGRPVFADPALPHFSIAYTGNIVGVALTTEGDCGLDMELQRVTRSFHGANALDEYPLSSNEKLWIRNQNDPVEAAHHPSPEHPQTERRGVRRRQPVAAAPRLRTPARDKSLAGRGALRR